MTAILHIHSGGNPGGSLTRQIGHLLVERLTASAPETRRIERDLVTDPLPHIQPDFVATMFDYDKSDAPALSLSNQLIEELFASDTIVLECPMYNFSIPSSVKAWIDHIVRARKTFRITDTGVEGLLKGKKTYLVLGRGAVYSDGPFQVMDFQEPYLRAMLGFIGLTDLEVVRIEGLNMGPEMAAAGIAKAKAQIASLATRP